MIRSTLCYIDSGDSYLMLHRTKKKNDTNQGKWIGIGGKIEDGETPEQCVIREVLEETGLTVVSPEYRAVVTFNSDTYPAEVMHLFTAKEFSGTLTDCSEGELAWILKSEVYSLPLWEGDKIFLNLISSDAPFFELDLEYESDKLVGAFLNGEELDV